MSWHCSVTLVTTETVVLSLYTIPHLQGMLYIPGVSSARSSLGAEGSQKIPFLGQYPSNAIEGGDDKGQKRQ
jgi:hypothetical protein